MTAREWLERHPEECPNRIFREAVNADDWATFPAIAHLALESSFSLLWPKGGDDAPRS